MNAATATDLFPLWPSADYRAHRREIDAAVLRALASGRHVLGEEVAAFEREFGGWLGEGTHVVGVANGTEALVIALQTLGIGPGDTVITVSHTAVATLAAIALTGAESLLVDIDPARFTIDPSRLEDCLRRESGRRRLRAIVPVHLYGGPADMAAVLGLARRYGLFVVEDCAQAVGARVDGHEVGLWGDAAAFSFYPTKNLSAAGDAGAIVTRDPALAARARELRQYGWDAGRVSRSIGRNSRLDDVQAAVLRVKLPYLRAANTVRRRLAALYSRLLAGAELVLPATVRGAEPVWHQYVVRSPRREALRATMLAAGVPVSVHYSPPAHLHPAYLDGRAVKDAAGLAETERAAREVLSLPLHAHLAESAIKYAADMVRECSSSASVVSSASDD